MRSPRTAPRALGGLLAVLGLTAACGTANSADVRTSGITADITVSTGDRGGVSYSASLRSGTLTDVSLTGSDTLIGETPDYRVTLEKSTFLGQVAYRGNIVETDAKPGEQMTVRLQRGHDDTSAPGSTVRMPAAVEITSPTAGSAASRARPLTFTVNPAPGTFRITWIGTCLAENSAGPTFAAGTPLVLPAGSLHPADATKAEECDVTFMVTRLLDGTLDPAYKGGSIHSERTATLTLTSRP